MDQFNAAEAAARLMALEGSQRGIRGNAAAAPPIDPFRDALTWQALKENIRPSGLYDHGGYGVPGMVGTPSGPSPPRYGQPPGMGSSENAGASASGLPGTQGGPVLESPTMQAERENQNSLGLTLGVLGGLGGMAYGGPVASAVGAAPGVGMMANSGSENIRDVWSDQLRMLEQQLARQGRTKMGY